jgi:uncharacterized protein YkwD
MGVGGAAAAVTLCTLFSFCSTAAASSACPADLDRPSPDTVATAGEALVCDINVARADNGLRPLRSDPRLAAGAQWMAADMAAHHYFAHRSSDGRTLADRIAPTGYLPAAPTWLLSENLGWGSGVLSSPLAVVLGWMDSPGHRENMLDPALTDIGIGIAPGPADVGGMVYVADFGTRGESPRLVTTGTPRARRVRLRRPGRPARALAGGNSRIRGPLDWARFRIYGEPARSSWAGSRSTTT